MPLLPKIRRAPVTRQQTQVSDDSEETRDSQAPRGASQETARARLLYGLSLPERAVRSAAGVVGGTLRDSAAVLLPDAVRGAKTYQAFIGQLLDFVAEDVGRIGAKPARTDAQEGFVARKTVGNFIDVASLATVHLSPMLLLAVVSDVAYGSKAYLRELADELERQGVVADAAKVRGVDDLLDQVAAASGDTANAFDLPPLSVEGLRETVAQVRESVAGIEVEKVVGKAELAALWEAMRATAKRDGVSPFRVSGVMALGRLEKLGKLGGGVRSTAQAAGALLDRHVFDHYRTVLAEIDEAGFYPSLAAVGKEYAQAASKNFAPERETLTERALTSAEGRLLAKARRWLPGRRRGARE